MEQINRYEDLSPRLSAQLKRGVVTNCFLSRQDYEREIENGLCCLEAEGFLLLQKQRQTHTIWNFYLHPGAKPVLPPLDKPAILELVWRVKDAEAVQAAAEAFCALGFQELFRRRRYTRLQAEPSADADAPLAKPEDADALLALMRENFDLFAGCIPTSTELAQQEAVCTRDGQGLSGLLHFQRGRAASEIRHLAVREDCRGQGLAGQLLAAYLQHTAGQKSQVWARQGNTPAECFYEKHQYRPDGWESVVLMAGGKETL